MSQLLPDKYVPLRKSLVGQGAIILSVLQNEAFAVARLYVETKRMLPHITYDNFILTLDWLFLSGSISFAGDRITKGNG